MTETRSLTPLQVAERLQVDEDSVVQWLCEGHLRGLKVGQEWWTSKRHLKTFLDHHANLPSRGADSSP